MRSGTSSHTREVAKYVRYYLDILATELGTFPPVKAAASVMREIIYSNKNFLSASMIVAGWDPYDGNQVYQVNSEGFFNIDNVVTSGSGSIFIAGYIDDNYRTDFTKQQAYDFLKKGIQYAIYRDHSCGGCVRIMDITSEGVERHFIPWSDFTFKWMVYNHLTH